MFAENEPVSSVIAGICEVPKRYALFAVQIFASRGTKALFISGFHFLKAKSIKLLSHFTTSRDTEQLSSIFEKHSGLPVLVTLPRLDWDVPLFQRPHHLALNFSRLGFLYFYSTDNWASDNVLGFRQIGENLILTNRADILVRESVRKVYILSSTDNDTTLDFVEQELAKGNLILYDYLDEIHDQISMMGVPVSTWIRHDAILKDERCMVIATADKLYRDVQAQRSRNFALVTNGAEFEHFSRSFSTLDVPEELQPIVSSGRKIIGYFGSLAAWFDYELILKIVRERPEFEIVLIGFDYDGSLGPYHLDEESRVHIIGPVDYRELPRYACWFDVATIPFLINEITESTSPIKLFEYMALGKPIVTTNMPECRKYGSVLIANTHEEFISQLDAALENQNDAEYLSLLKADALANTWEAKAAAIAELIIGNLRSV